MVSIENQTKNVVLLRLQPMFILSWCAIYGQKWPIPAWPGKDFPKYRRVLRKMVIAVQVKNLTKKDLTATDEVENPKNPSKATD